MFCIILYICMLLICYYFLLLMFKHCLMYSALILYMAFDYVSSTAEDREPVFFCVLLGKYTASERAG